MPNAKCPQCNTVFVAEVGRANRAASIGAPLYCGRACAGLARRRAVQLTDEQKRAAKAEYDRSRRIKLGSALKERNRIAYYANHAANLARMTKYRKTRMHKHVEYCRHPEYKAYKHEYDKKRAEAEYGEWAETWRLLLDIEKEIRSQATAYERRVANGYYTRNAQKRRRELCQLRENLNSTQAT